MRRSRPYRRGDRGGKDRITTRHASVNALYQFIRAHNGKEREHRRYSHDDGYKDRDRPLRRSRPYRRINRGGKDRITSRHEFVDAFASSSAPTTEGELRQYSLDDRPCWGTGSFLNAKVYSRAHGPRRRTILSEGQGELYIRRPFQKPS